MKRFAVSSRKQQHHKELETIMKRTGYLIVAIMLIASTLLSGCGTGKSIGNVANMDVIEKYNFLIKDYQDAQREIANGKNCVVLAFTDINTQIGLANLAMQAEVQRTSAYAATVKSYFDTASTNLDGKTPNQAITEANNTAQQQLNAYNDENGQPLSADKLDLAKIVKAGAMPDQLATSFNVQAMVYTQAPLPAANFDPIKNAQWVTTEKTNLMLACTKSSNEVISKYNTDRAQVPGNVVGSLANYLHVSDLPESLPYFTVAGPSQVVPVPTFGAP
jgi:predicted small secreted protein